MKLHLDTGKAKWILACLLPLLSFFILFPDYIVRHSFFWICLLTLPVSIIKDTSCKFPFFRHCLLLCAITLILPTTIGTYVFVCSLLLFIGQQMIGGIHVIGLIHAFLASPFFTYFSSLVSFPIRLQLSRAVSYLLNFSGIESRVDGNIIHLGDQSFLVDQACSGMYLLGYGMLFGTLILSMRIRVKTIKWKRLVLHYSLLFVLIIWGNLVRIYFLVVFNVESGHWMHNGVGLIIYVLQILLPFYLIHRIGMKQTVKESDRAISPPRFPRYKYAFLSILLVLLFVKIDRKKNEESIQQPVISLAGFQSEVVKNNVTKLSNDQALIYLKSPVAAYSADHNPMICWSGSGYEFQKVEKIVVDQFEVNASELKKGTITLHTAWWFESRKSKTGDQLDWRTLALKNGEQFYLVNLTCNTREELISQIEKLTKSSIITTKYRL